MAARKNFHEITVGFSKPMLLSLCHSSRIGLAHNCKDSLSKRETCDPALKQKGPPTKWA
jgi:hypothetical protein